jgi:hypothetical protein
MQAHFLRARVGSLCRSARADAQPALQAPAKSAAQSQSSSGLQHYLVFTVVLEFQALDPLEVDDRRAVDAAELRRVELALELDEAAAQHVCFDYQGASTEGSARTEGIDCNTRVNRGGSWTSIPTGLRAAHRGADHFSNTRVVDLGFRVARTP